jgi:gas vesicle protein
MAGTTAGTSTGTPGADGSAKDQAQEKAQEVRDQAGERVREATGQARDRVREQIDQRSTRAGEQVHQHAGDLRDVASQLREQGKDAPARVADQVAERAERAGSWMKDSDADRILADIEDAARSNPWAVAAGGLALGFVASRVLKASSSRRYEQRDTAPRLPAPGGTTVNAPGGPVAGGLTTVGVVDEPRTPPPEPPARPSSPRPRVSGEDDLRTPARGGGL